MNQRFTDPMTIEQNQRERVTYVTISYPKGYLISGTKEYLWLMM